MDGDQLSATPQKRGRGRPRKTAKPVVAESEPVLLANEILVGDSADTGVDIERELEQAMQATTETPVYCAPSVLGDDAPSDFPDAEYDDAVGSKQGLDHALNTKDAKTKNDKVRVKKMTSTTRKMMKFGYTQILRTAEPLTKGKVPGEKMAYILNNDEQAEAILDEILTELDQKYKVEQYFNPESKLAMFTVQLFMQAKSS